MLAEYPSDYSRAMTVPAVHVQHHSPRSRSMSNWSPCEEDLTIFPEDFSNALYYERFQDGSLYEEVEDDDDEDLSFSSCLLEENLQEEQGEEVLYEIQSPTRSFSEVVCGSSDSSDYLQSTFMSILPDHHLLDDLPLMPETSSRKEKVKGETETRDISSRKRKVQEISWKNLSQREKQEMVEELLATISYTLGPRERLEVARILDTDGDISGVSYVLSINPENLSEEKVTQIRNLLEEASDEATSRRWRDLKQERSSKVKSESTSKGVLKKQKIQKSGSTLRGNLSRLTRERQSKECKQNTKEKKSGLFEQEEVISLYCDGSSDAEVDILE